MVTLFNDVHCVRPFYDRAKAVLDGLPELGAWQIVFVNDASTDGSLEEVRRLHDQDARVKFITMARTFGYHSVVVAGLSLVESDLYAVIDVDAEDPPELLAEFYARIRGGAQVAYGIRSNRDEPMLVTVMRRWFYRINRVIADSEVVMWMAEFSMMTRQVRNAVLVPRTTFPFIRSELGYVGFKREGVPYRRAKRLYGQSHLNLMRMTQFAVGGFLASSTFLLRWVLYLSVALAVLFPALSWWEGWSLYRAAEWAIIFLLYYALFTIPIISLYLARVYKNGVARPVYVVDETLTQL